MSFLLDAEERATQRDTRGRWILVDIHNHIANSHSRERFLDLSAQGRTGHLGPEFVSKEEKQHRRYDSLSKYHKAYEGMRPATKTPEDYRIVTEEYLTYIGAQYGGYAEISNSFRSEECFPMQMEAIAEGANAAEDKTDIKTRLCVTAIRDPKYGPELALRTAEYLVENRARFPMVTTFGVAGDEAYGSISDYEAALLHAYHGGFSIAPHIGEQNIQDAASFVGFIRREKLKNDPKDERSIRCGHLTMIHRSTEIMEAIGEADICLEACISANNRIAVPDHFKEMAMAGYIESASGRTRFSLDRPLKIYYQDLSAHPLPDFFEFGLPAALGADGTIMLNTCISKEYALAAQMGFSDDQIANFSRNGVKYGGLKPDEKTPILQRIDKHELQMVA